MAVPVLDDEVVEGRERFQGRLSLPQETLDLGVISLADESLAEVTIIDNDSKNMHLASLATWHEHFALHSLCCINCMWCVPGVKDFVYSTASTGMH